MALAAGTRLGPYEVLGLIDAGGMGEVYHARDTRLDRTVAIKVLPADVASDAERRARFEREARTISTLSHPHICTLYDVGDREGVPYLVMEHLAGETLAERLKKGPLPLDRVLDLGAQIADALSAAHKHGIVHRDLKPGNVMLTRTGAKLLDFGLAKLTGHGERPALAPETIAGTETGSLTGRGTVLGTLPYMAPEQLEGKPADARADLWALGTMLYEMVTGQRAFEGTSSVSLIGNIMNAEPPALATVNPLTPPSLERLVRRCLAKDPDQRWDSAHDLADELRWIAQASSEAPATAVRPRRWSRVGVLLVGAAAIALATAGWLRLFPVPVASTPPVYMTIPLQSPLIAAAGQIAFLAISPDGQLLLFRDDERLVLRPLGSFGTTPLEGTRGATFPTFKPDGSAVAFVANERIRRVAVGGGSVTDVAHWDGGIGIAWGDDDQIYFSAGLGTGGIWRVPATGGTPETVTRVDDAAGENAHTWPQPLPGGRALLFTALGPSGGSDDARVVAQVLGTQQHLIVAEKAIGGRYVESGHLVYAKNDGTVYAVPFDPARLKTSGTPVPVLIGVGTATWGGQAFLVVSSNGTLAFLKPTQRPDYLFRSVDSKGSTAMASFGLDRATTAKLGPFVQSPRVAPDGQRTAVTVRSPGACDVWVLDARAGEAERLTFDAAEDEFPVWSPDARAVAYTSSHTASTRRIFVKTVASGMEPKLLRTWPQHIHVASWSPDGRWLAADDGPSTTDSKIWAIPLDGSEPVTLAHGTSPRFSPDGRWIAYVSHESGRWEVYALSFPDLKSRRQVSAGGGRSPAWDGQGRFLYYLQQGYLVAQEVRLGTELGKGRATRLFATPAFDFEVAPGNLFLLTEPNPQPADEPLHLIVNWFSELRAKAPTR